MIKAINLTKTISYELSFDEHYGTDQATKWTLGALDSRVLATIKDKATSIPVAALNGSNEGSATLNLNQTNFEVVLFGLKGFTNFQDEEGKQIPYKTVLYSLAGKSYSVADPELVKMIPPEGIDELATEILGINSVREEERKNSEG